MQTSFHDWGRAFAGFWMWAPGARNGAFVYNGVKLLVAATMRAAEFEVPRSCPIRPTEEHAFKMIIAANDQVSGCWRGGQRGAVSFPHEAATANGAALNGALARRGGWGLEKGASGQRNIQAFSDIRSCPSILHY